MSVPDSEPTPALEVLFVRCSCQQIYPVQHQCSGPIFHRDSFDIYRETWYRNGKGKKKNTTLEWDSAGEEEGEKRSSLVKFVTRIRQAWSTLPWSAAARERKRSQSESSSTDEDPELSPSDYKKLKSISHESEHAHFANKDPRSASTRHKT